MSVVDFPHKSPSSSQSSRWSRRSVTIEYLGPQLALVTGWARDLMADLPSAVIRPEWSERRRGWLIHTAHISDLEALAQSRRFGVRVIGAPVRNPSVTTVKNTSVTAEGELPQAVLW